MHSTNMIAIENCCIFSCNLLSQRYFNGNLSHAFQTCSHLLLRHDFDFGTMSPPHAIPSLGAIAFPPASTVASGHVRASTVIWNYEMFKA